jgi:8-amino-7-oxononanoate synthase
VSSTDFLDEELRDLEARGLRRRLRSVDGPQRARVLIDGREVLNFSSNNYLGLADHPALRDAAVAALEEDGVGSGASRLIVGNLRAHRDLEAEIAAFHGTEAALVFNSGYQANVGILAALAGHEDVIFSDALNHASLIDGCRLSRARTDVYAHGDAGDLRRRLATASARRRFVVSDSVFSMDGDIASVAELRRIADEANAILIIDEAHATGCLGPGGRGIAAQVGVRADVHMATLSKGFGCFGAYVAGSRALIDVLLNRARSFVFTTALPPSVPAAALAAIRLCRSSAGDALREDLSRRVARFREGLRSLGILVPGSGETAIFPVLIGDERRTMEASEMLLRAGIYAQGIRPPTVPRGTSRLRFALMATHEIADLDRALAALADLVRSGLIPRRDHP